MSFPGGLFDKALETIRAADRILLVTHLKPDGDAVGSVTAVRGWLEREGKDVTTFCRDPLPEQLRFLDPGRCFTQDVRIFDREYDALITLDAGELKVCGLHEILPRLPSGYTHVVIDHHPTNQRFGHVNIVDPAASSTCEIVHRFFETNRIGIDQAMATSLLTGIFYDTSNFSNSGTTSASLAAAASLLAAGARLPEILTRTLKDKTVGSLRLWGLMMSRLIHDTTHDLVTTYILEKDFAYGTTVDMSDMTSGFSNFLNAVSGQAGTVMILQELPSGEVKGSLRSVDKDVSAMAKLLGGGGHAKAAGFTVRGRIQETEKGPKITGSDQPVGTLGF